MCIVQWHFVFRKMWNHIIVFTAITMLCFELSKGHYGRNDRIVGGEIAKISDFPHVAALIIYNEDSNEGWLCGSSILNQRILLTAAHCFENYDKTLETLVSVGDENINAGTAYKIIDHIVHEHYDKHTIANDVAVMKSKVPIKFVPGKVQKAVVMRSPSDDRFGWISGWGLVQESPPNSSEVLKCLKQILWDDKKCDRQRVPNGVICTEENSMNTPSFGDSGSALVIRKYITVGVLSFKRISPSYFAAYSSVSYHYDWIYRNTKILYCRNIRA